jgi:hypothetical protein
VTTLQSELARKAVSSCRPSTTDSWPSPPSVPLSFHPSPLNSPLTVNKSHLVWIWYFVSAFYPFSLDRFPPARFCCRLLFASRLLFVSPPSPRFVLTAHKTVSPGQTPDRRGTITLRATPPQPVDFIFTNSTTSQINSI